MKVVFFIMDKTLFSFDYYLKLFPEIEQLKNINQNPKYHKEGNVFIHTKKVCEQVKKLEQWNNLSNNEKFILYMSCFFHDIGKLICTKLENGEIVSPKHAIIGAKTFRELIYKVYSEQYNIDFYTRETIANLIKYHGLPLFFIEKTNLDYEIIKASQCVNIQLLYLLAKADLLGRDCDDKENLLNNIELFKDYCIELNCFYNKKQFYNNYTRLLYFNNKNIWYNDEIFDNRKFKVILMIGIPLSGKDTYIKENFSNIPIISLDDIREEFKISPKDSSKKVVTIAKERAKVFLRQKKTFIWNATNIIKDTRNSLLNLFISYGAIVEYIYLEVPYKEILKRYNKRERIVPINVIDKMINKMDMVEPYEADNVLYVLNN